MKFESEVATYDFYNDYNKRIGFGIRREYGNKSRIDGVLTSRRFTCLKRVRELLTKDATNGRVESRNHNRMHNAYGYFT